MNHFVFAADGIWLENCFGNINWILWSSVWECRRSRWWWDFRADADLDHWFRRKIINGDIKMWGFRSFNSISSVLAWIIWKKEPIMFVLCSHCQHSAVQSISSLLVHHWTVPFKIKDKYCCFRKKKKDNWSFEKTRTLCSCLQWTHND